MPIALSQLNGILSLCMVYIFKISSRVCLYIYER
uniref:Uncharacterized protein n=1 Tax=Utricularia reniformis TaxID=192314 RepID=A0A1Y0B401_9LAMI|nr:hypothetical protein AEK19_MT1978 [Utricularia reniformis]ART32141.1 hypothetical protein AEK19_MT1978 [Utricularia reniformis]